MKILNLCLVLISLFYIKIAGALTDLNEVQVLIENKSSTKLEFLDVENREGKINITPAFHNIAPKSNQTYKLGIPTQQGVALLQFNLYKGKNAVCGYKLTVAKVHTQEVNIEASCQGVGAKKVPQPGNNFVHFVFTDL